MIRISLENFQTREEWLELRRSGIGGSDASVIAGVNKYRSVTELWLEKTGKTDMSEEESEAIYWGNTLEEVIRQEFGKRSGMVATKPPYMYRSEEHPCMIANLDGEVEDEIYGTCIFEAKTVSAYKKDEWDNGIPIEYYLQLQHYMAVTHYKGAYIAALIGGNEFTYRFIEHSEETIEMLIEMELDFWENVGDNVPPDLDGSDAAKKYLANTYPRATKKGAIDLGEVGEVLVEQYDEICAQEDHVKEMKQYVENQLKSLLKDNESGLAGNRRVNWTNVSSHRLDTKRLKVDEPELYDQYVSITTSRRFSVA